VESEGGNYLLVANPSNTALSYYLLLDGDWRGNHLTRLHPSALDPAKKAFGASVSDPQGLLHCVLGYYRIDAVIVDRAPDATTPDQLALASEISRNGSFALSKSFGAIDIYSVQKKG
jgi:hypothetical protein